MQSIIHLMIAGCALAFAGSLTWMAPMRGPEMPKSSA